MTRFLECRGRRRGESAPLGQVIRKLNDPLQKLAAWLARLFPCINDYLCDVVAGDVLLIAYSIN